MYCRIYFFIKVEVCVIIMSLDNIKLGIFDHSGVLSDDRLPVYEANMVLLGKNGVDRITFAEWLVSSKASAGDFIRSFGVDVLKDELDGEYEKIYTEIVTRKDNPIRPEMYSGVPSVLRRLQDNRGLKLAIVSSHPKSNLIIELGEYGILGFFDEISGDPMPKEKRLGLICDAFCISPMNSFFVEDTIYGLRSGNNAGVNCFGVTTGYHSREKLEAEGTAIAVIDSLDELFDYV
jgi:phosphoglycolate phosphatase-like HAD superfamily hydrolase